MKTSVYKMSAGIGEYLPAGLPVAASPNIENRLYWAGRSEQIDYMAWGNIKRLAGLIGAAAAFILAPGWLAFALVIPAFYAGTYLPDVVLDSEIEKVRNAIDRELPAFAENLAILAGAGVSMGLALPEAAANVPGILGRRLLVAVNEIRLGSPRATVLVAAAADMPSRDFQRLAGLIADTERFGTPVAAELARMAAYLREKRMAALREETQKLPVKMLFPLVFMILPAFILLTAGPMFVSLVQ